MFRRFVCLFFVSLVPLAAWAPLARAGLQQVKIDWRYTTSKPPGNWTALEFDDKAWKRDQPPYGCRAGLPPFQQSKVKTTWETPDIWVRGTFDLDRPAWWALLHFSHDEDVEIYINGKLAIRRPGYVTNYVDERLVGARAKLLHAGKNVIAAHCRQTVGGQFLDIQLMVFSGELPEIIEPKSIPRPEYPRPDFVRSAWKNLNGPWEFKIDPKRKGLDEGLQWGKTLPRTITVPFPPESKLSGIHITEPMRHVWYHRAVRVPRAWKKKRVLLHFGAVDYDATVWVNGIEVGTHRGGYTPFYVDITDTLVDRIADIVVLADDPMNSPTQPTGKQARGKPHGCIYTRVTGIWQTVWLEGVPPTHIASVRLIPDVANRQVLIAPQVLRPSPDVKLKATAILEGEIVGKAVFDLKQGLFFPLRLSKLELWDIGKPRLYDLELALTQNGKTIDEVKTYFGMRTVSIEDEKILLNGRPVFQRLVLDQGYYPDGIYTAPTDEALRHDIEISQGLGFNGARLHMKVFEPRFLYWADRLGYIVWGEFPNWGLDHSNPAALAEHLSEWVEALRRDINHPSIVGWCPFNETPANEDRAGIRRAYLVTKLIDPTRPVIDTSGYVHVITDVYDCHNYTQSPADLKRAFADFAQGGKPWHNNAADAPYQGQPFMVSEFGGTWWNPGRPGWGYGNNPKTKEEFLKRFRGLVEALLFHPKMAGFCYTQLYDIEQEVNGLYTYDRKPKFDPAKIRAILSQRAAIEKE